MRRAARRLLWWMLIVAWLGLIWHFGESQVLIAPWRVAALQWFVRKSTHLVVYGVLGGLLVPALGTRPRWGWVMSLCLLIALGDEVHQEFVPRRSFALHDVGLDLLSGMLGAFSMVVGLMAVRRKGESRHLGAWAESNGGPIEQLRRLRRADRGHVGRVTDRRR